MEELDYRLGTPNNPIEKNEYEDHVNYQLKSIISRIGKDKIVTEDQKALIRFVLENEDAFQSHWEETIIRKNIIEIFSDPDFYDIVMARLLLQKKKLDLKIREAQVVKNKTTEAFNKLKQERNLFFPL